MNQRVHPPQHRPDATPAPDAWHPEGVTSPGLDERDRAILAFEQQWWRFGGERDAAVRDRFGLSAAEYHRVLSDLIDRPEAESAEPLLVRRLRRQRAARQRARAEARRG